MKSYNKTGECSLCKKKTEQRLKKGLCIACYHKSRQTKFVCSSCSKERHCTLIKGVCHYCYQATLLRLGTSAYSSMLAYRRRRYLAIKGKIFDVLGRKCLCCGEETLEFLTVDHINNDGAYHKKLRKNTNLYHAIVKEGIDITKYQTLCYNCNCAKGKYGVCPHERLRKEKYSSS